MSAGDIRDFTASDGVRLRFRHWQSESPRGVVLALHGIQSHSGWYKYSSRYLSESGFDVYFADRRGSGLNGFQRGHSRHGMRLIHDVRALNGVICQETRQRTGRTLPVILMGLSWGGKIAAATAALFPNEFSGLALLYPGLIPLLRFSRWQQLRLDLARRWEIIRRDIPIPLRDPALLTDSAVWQRFIEDDPLSLHTVTSGLLNSGRDLDEMLRTHGRTLTIPTLLMQAGKDRIIDNAATRSLVQSLVTLHLTRIMYPNSCHTLEFDFDRELIFRDLLHWLNAIVQRLHGQDAATPPPTGP